MALVRTTSSRVRDMVDGDKMIPFIRQFYGSPSTFLWDDDFGKVHHVHQGEGGELFAFLDDVYVICRPTRVQEVFQLLETELRSRASISIHLGETKFWNAGIEPTGVAGLSAAARMHDPQAVVWRGDQGLPTVQQGLKVLGALVGLHPKLLVPERVGARPFARDDPTSPRRASCMVVAGVLRIHSSEFFLRTVSPEFTLEFAERHDKQVFKCLSKVLQTETLHPRNHEAATMRLTLGGLGLGNAEDTRRRTLGELGRQFGDDQSPAPRSGT